MSVCEGGFNMRTVLKFATAMVIATVQTGCAKKEASVVEPTVDSQSSTESQLGLHLAWPGPPNEGRTTVPGPGGDVQTYSAMYASKAPGLLVVYLANVIDSGTGAANQMDSRERVTAFMFTFQKTEISRKEFEHGSEKHPGLDVLRPQGKNVSRALVVVVGQRIYSVSVSAPNEELLTGPEVMAFFNSFTIDGKAVLPTSP